MIKLQRRVSNASSSSSVKDEIQMQGVINWPGMNRVLNRYFSYEQGLESQVEAEAEAEARNRNLKKRAEAQTINNDKLPSPA